MSDLEAELKGIDPIDLLSSNEIIDAIQIFDSTVEIIGYVDRIKLPRRDNQNTVFQFVLNNGNGRRIQVVAWNDDINNILHHIERNNIIHLDGVRARRLPKETYFNNGNVSFELLIHQNTVISKLGKYEPSNLEMEPVTIELRNIMDTTQRIILEAYIKTNFSEAHDKERNKMIGYGSITDGTYKVEVHIMNFTNDEYRKLGIRKGDKIKITGLPRTQNDTVYLSVNSIKNIDRINGRMELPMLLKAVQNPKKRKFGETSQEIERKEARHLKFKRKH